jgi:hypothetical protein
MKVGDLVKGKVNELLGIVTEVLQCEHQLRSDRVKVYWVASQLSSTIWQRRDELEVLCE